MTERDIGRHEALISELLKGQERMQTDITDIKDILAEKKGERRAAIWFVSTASAVMGSTLAFIAHALFGVKS